MICEFVQTVLLESITGGTPVPPDIEEHSRTCTNCTRFLALHQTMAMLLKKTPRHESPAFVETVLFEKLEVLRQEERVLPENQIGAFLSKLPYHSSPTAIWDRIQKTISPWQPRRLRLRVYQARSWWMRLGWMRAAAILLPVVLGGALLFSPWGRSPRYEFYYREVTVEDYSKSLKSGTLEADLGLHFVQMLGGGSSVLFEKPEK